MSKNWRMSVSNTQQKADRKASQSVLNKSMEGNRTPHLPGAANYATARKIELTMLSDGFEASIAAMVSLAIPEGAH
jgi:hypothetical protein